MNNIREIQKNQFGGLHDFHTERTASMLEALQDEFGDEIVKVLEDIDIDKYGLYRWHLERTLSIIDTLSEKIGSEVVDSVIKRQETLRREQGTILANELSKNTLDDIIPFFTGGNIENIIEKSDTDVLIKTTGCLVGRVAYDINKGEEIYALHCNTDKDFVEGFNSKLGCEVVKTLIEGNDCCIHRIYIKN